MLRILLLCCCMLISTELFAELMDPTKPPDFTEGKKVNPETLQVYAIVYSDKRRIAVINGEPMQEEQTLFGNRIVDIKPNSVQLEGPSGRINLDLVKQPVKKNI